MRKEEHDTPQNGYKAPAVHKAFALLREVAKAKHGMRLVELADRLGYSKSTTHGLVHALLRERALIQDEDAHELFLGPLIADLAFTNWNYVKVNEVAQPIINEVRDHANATVFLGVRIRTRVMITAKAEALDALKVSAPLGTTMPLFAGAVGKVFLAQESPERVRQLVGERGIPRYTANSLTNLEDYLAELQRVRAQGFAIDDEEYLSGIRAVAVGLNNLRGLPTAIWAVGFAGNMGLAKLQQVADEMVVAAKKLRSRLEELGNTRLGSTATGRSEKRYIQPDSNVEADSG